MEDTGRVGAALEILTSLLGGRTTGRMIMTDQFYRRGGAAGVKGEANPPLHFSSFFTGWSPGCWTSCTGHCRRVTWSAAPVFPVDHQFPCLPITLVAGVLEHMGWIWRAIFYAPNWPDRHQKTHVIPHQSYMHRRCVSEPGLTDSLPPILNHRQTCLTITATFCSNFTFDSRSPPYMHKPHRPTTKASCNP